MAKQTINIGTSANDGTGSTLRAAFDICNDNFTELYDGTGGLLYKFEGTNFTNSLLIGHNTTGTLSSAEHNVGIGVGTLDALTSGQKNVAIGVQAATSITSGNRNIALGYRALFTQTTAADNIGIGQETLRNDEGGRNIAIGYQALRALNRTATGNNLAIGYRAGAESTSGRQNVFLGDSAGRETTTGSYNVAIGYAALLQEDDSGRNVAIGYEALRDQNTSVSSANTAVGYQAGTNVTTGINNTIIGGLAGDALTTGSNNIIIGKDAAASAVDVSNEVTIGDGNITNVRIPSDSTLKIGASGDLQIEHVSSNSFIKNTAVGDLYIENQVDNGDVIFRSDDGSGGLATYFSVDGGDERVNFSKNAGFSDNVKAMFGNGLDLRIYHNATNSIIENTTGDLIIQNNLDDKDIIFKSDDGSGGIATYMTIDGSTTKVTLQKDLRADDGVKIQVGSSGDLFMVHESDTGKITNGTGNLEIIQNTDDGDIIFKSDDDSGGVTEYFRVDGGLGKIIFNKGIRLVDNQRLDVGGATDGRFFHDGTDTQLTTITGDLIIKNSNDDGDISFRSDDGSGGTTEYFRLDGSLGSGSSVFTVFPDNSRATFGNGYDLQIYHDATNSYLKQQGGGDLIIQQETNDKDVIFKSDDGSGGVATYFQLDGSDVVTLFSKATRHIDSVAASFGNSNDLKIQHNATDNFVDSYTGHLNIRNHNADKDIVFQADDGSGGLAEYFRVDGGSEAIIISKNVQHADNVKAYFGNAIDLQIYHDGSNSYISNNTNHLYIQQLSDNKDIVFQSDDSSGGVAEYFRVDGGSRTVVFSKTLNAVNSSANGKAATFDDGTSALHIVPSLGSGGYTGLSTAGDIGLIFTIDNDNTTDSTSNGLLIAPHTQTSGGLKILENGNVGIGITNPSSKLVVSGGDIETSTESKGLILKSPNGTRYRVTVDNSGNLSTTAL